ncbi:hypothetical protein [Natronorarus salvus]|uniref:hypothetical protein n=1 Tax=Natronorarus salvus TaxID=3117733 RepID=UPI002F262D35
MQTGPRGPTFPSDDRATLTGACERCPWTAEATSHARLARRYQDHLRAEHPKAWLRG